MKKVFLFQNIRLDSVKVSHALAVGLPSLTGLTGLASAFAAELARDVGLAPTELSYAGVLLAFEDYKLHEGYKKITDANGRGVAPRALASAFASFTAHLVIEVESNSPAAADVLANADLVNVSRDVLRSLRLCGASLLDARRPSALHAQKVRDLGGERAAAVQALPSSARVLVDASAVVELMRADEAHLSLMEGLLAATLLPAKRPQPFKQFFDTLAEATGQFHATYGVVHDGYLLVGQTSKAAHRASFDGQYLPVAVGSPTLTLVRLQTAASLRSKEALEDGTHFQDYAFWKMHSVQGGFLCRPTFE